MMNSLFVNLFVICLVTSLVTGRSQSEWGSRVIGGADANSGEFPSMVSLRRAGSHFCGGSIIKDSVILTAAHCVLNVSISAIHVVSGSHLLSTGGNIHNVSQVVMHENYSDTDSWRNDIALLKLSEPIVLGTLEKAVDLPSQDEDPGSNADSVICGWGYTKYPSSSLPDVLQKLTVKLTTNDQCRASQATELYPTNLCVATTSATGVCSGDSGGPLISSGKQVGIASWVKPCANGVPDVYTRVASYATWIAQNSQ